MTYTGTVWQDNFKDFNDRKSADSSENLNISGLSGSPSGFPTARLDLSASW